MAALSAAVDAARDRVLEALSPGDAFAYDTKSDAADLVTAVDPAVEALVRRIVLERFPEDGFAGEELGRVREDAPWRWWVDPIDGTMNFAHGLPYASVSVALAHEGATVAGEILNVFTGTRFTAVRGGGAHVAGRRLRIDPDAGLAGAVVVTELMNQHPWPAFDVVLRGLAERYATLRVMGSTALSLAYTAAGSAAALVMRLPSPIDAAAGMLLVEEAGGVLVRREEGPVPMLVAGGAQAVATVAALLDSAAGGAPQAPVPGVKA